jgi:hypothetical protein
MANTNVYSTKSTKLVFALEPTSGTAVAIASGTTQLRTVPAQDLSIATDRGTRLIDRSTVLDGGPGGICSTWGSYGATVSFSAELHDVEGMALPTWVRLLMAAGHEVFVDIDTVDAPVSYIRPSTKTIANFAAVSPWTPVADTTYNPASATLCVAHEIEGATDPVRLQVVSGATGTAEFSFVPGERALINFTFVGLSAENILDAVDNVTFSTLGAYESGDQCHPFVVKGITLSIIDDTDGDADALQAANLSSFTLTTNAETPEVVDPRSPTGYAVSPVLFNTYPTVAFTLGSTAADEVHVMDSLVKGYPATVEVTLQSPISGNELKLTIPLIQYEDVAWGENGGYRTLEFTARVVRESGQTAPMYQLAWTYGPAPTPP